MNRCFKMLAVTGLAAFFVAPCHAQQTINGGIVRAGTLPVGAISATGTASGTTFLRGDGSWQVPAGGGSGTVTSVAGPSFIDWLLSGTSYTGSYATGLTSNEYDVLGVDGSGNAGLYPITASWLPASGVTAGTYTNPTLGIDATGRVIAASSGVGSTVLPAVAAATSNQANSGIGTGVTYGTVAHENSYHTTGLGTFTLGITCANANDFVLVTADTGANVSGLGSATFTSAAAIGNSGEISYAFAPTAGSYTLSFSASAAVLVDVYSGVSASSPITFGTQAYGAASSVSASVTTVSNGSLAGMSVVNSQALTVGSGYTGLNTVIGYAGSEYASSATSTGGTAVTPTMTEAGSDNWSAVAYAIAPPVSGGTSVVIDGMTISAGAVVLEADQTTASQNGLWVASSGAWTRPSNFASGSTVAPGTQVSVLQGTANGGTTWILTNTANVTVDTTAQTWAKTSPSGGASLVTSLPTATSANRGQMYLVEAPALPAYPAPSGVIFRLDASQITGVANGANITTWADVSGNNDNATASGTVTYKTNALNGMPGIYFNGGVNYLTLANVIPSEAITVYVVEQQTGDAYMLYNGATGTGQVRVYQSGNSVMSTYDGTNNPQSSTMSVASGGTDILAYVFSGATGTVSFYEKGISHGSGACNQNQGLQYIGSNTSGHPQYLNGYIYEMIVVGSAQTSTQIAAMNTYLADKWTAAQQDHLYTSAFEAGSYAMQEIF